MEQVRTPNGMNSGLKAGWSGACQPEKRPIALKTGEKRRAGAKKAENPPECPHRWIFRLGKSPASVGNQLESKSKRV